MIENVALSSKIGYGGYRRDAQGGFTLARIGATAVLADQRIQPSLPRLRPYRACCPPCKP